MRERGVPVISLSEWNLSIIRMAGWVCGIPAGLQTRVNQLGSSSRGRLGEIPQSSRRQDQVREIILGDLHQLA
ncbi:hypothetical protein KSP40_PGU022775 [Platanthera guangdongensis]|uniref:Uncharacterized protein n=1 Tax=Platanthera guangdongensis TaxID=2320717 RepID=A0ABR2LG34_9ASPA